jgi:ABC-2 type transport system permease protein
MTDRWQGTYFRIARADANPFGAFALRAVPLYGAAALLVVVTYATVGLAAGMLPLALDALRWSSVLAASIFATSMLGLFVIAPAIGTRYDTLTYNAATTVLTVLCGAIIPVPDVPVLAQVAQALPLTHGITSLRAGMAGGDWLTPLISEVVVGAGWAAAAWLLYGAQARRARRAGSGAMA